MRGHFAGIHPSDIPASRVQLATRLVHRAFANDQRLRDLCRRLFIDLRMWLIPGAIAVPDLPLAPDFATWLTQTRQLRFRATLGYLSNFWGTVLLALRNMPHLQKAVFEVHLHMALPLAVAPIGNELSAMPVPTDISKWEQSQSVVSISVRGFDRKPADLQSLVAWPARLRHFTFEQPHYNHHRTLTIPAGSQWQWALSNLLPLLSCQSASLETLQVGKLPKPGLEGVNLSGLPHLKTLRVAHGTTEARPGAIALMAPYIREFSWLFKENGQHWGTPYMNHHGHVALGRRGRAVLA